MSASASTSAFARSSSASERSERDHLQRVLAGQRREPDADVAEHLGRPAARAAGDDRAEPLVGQHADEHLDARVRHPLDEEVLDRRARRLERLRDLLRRAPDRGRPAQPEPHRARLRLVHDAGRDALQRDRPAELAGRLRRRGGATTPAAARPARSRRRRAAPGPRPAAASRRRARASRRGSRRPRRRRCRRAAAARPAARRASARRPRRARAPGRRARARGTCGTLRAPSRSTAGSAPGVMNTASSGTSERHAGERGRGVVGPDRDVLDVDRDHGVDAGSRRRSTAAANSVRARRPAGRAGSPARLTTSSPASAHASAHTTSGPRALATIPTPLPPGTPLLGEHGGGVEQVVEPVAADHARAREQRVDGAVGRGDQRARVRSRRARARRRAPRLDRQHRLGARHPPRDAPELARVAERLQVQRDDLRRRVLLPELQQVVARQVGLVAERDERAQPDPAPRHAVDRRRAERAALGDEADRARRGRRRARTSPSATRRGAC